jgi:hypothetical protein
MVENVYNKGIISTSSGDFTRKKISTVDIIFEIVLMIEINFISSTA